MISVRLPNEDATLVEFPLLAFSVCMSDERSKDVTRKPQGHELLTPTLTWHASQYKVHEIHRGYILKTQKKKVLCGKEKTKKKKKRQKRKVILLT